MNATILFPSDYFDLNVVSDNFSAEYNAVNVIDGLEPALFNFDAFIDGMPLKLKMFTDHTPELVIYRGWMMKPAEYEKFYIELNNLGFDPITSPLCYEKMHCFPNAASVFEDQTPRFLVFPEVNGKVHIEADVVNRTFDRFMVKDYVKSVKGASFPAFIETPIEQSDLDNLIERFISLREPLFTGGIVLKEHVDLKRYDGCTNEWREFIFGYGMRLSIARNSSQSEFCPAPPDSYLATRNILICPFYTVDHAELADGSWTIVEAGDGQVSGIASTEDPFRFYQRIADYHNRPDWNAVED